MSRISAVYDGLSRTLITNTILGEMYRIYEWKSNGLHQWSYHIHKNKHIIIDEGVWGR